MLSFTEENYLKAIYHLSGAGERPVLTNELAETMQTKPASVTDMVKKLSAKNLIAYEKYYGVNLLKPGKLQALQIIRKHRLWETFLVNKLGFTWDEVHEVAEQLEHIQSGLLIEKLDKFLEYPTVDPHGHPIPDPSGKIKEVKQIPLAEFPAYKKCTIRAVKNGSPSFLQYLSKIGIYIDASVSIVDKVEFDGSLEVSIDNKKRVFISREAAQNLMVTG